MSKVIVFVLGIVVGGGLFFLGNFFGVTPSVQSETERLLATRIESIPIETICGAIGSGKQILGDDHVTVWSDSKRYRVVGWQVANSGIPVFYWTGADLPADVSGCKKKPV